MMARKMHLLQRSPRQWTGGDVAEDDRADLNRNLLPAAGGTVTLGDNLWLLFGSLIGIGGACAVAYGVNIIERLIRNRRASIAPSSAVDRSPMNARRQRQ
jgi:hypothetical protein